MSTTWYDPFGWFVENTKADERSQIPGDSEVLSERVALTSSTRTSDDRKESLSQDKFSSWVAEQQLSYWKTKGLQRNEVGNVRRGRCGCGAPSMEDLCGDEDEEQAEISTLIKAYPTHVEESTILAQAALLVPRHHANRNDWPEEAQRECLEGTGTSCSSTKPMVPALGSRMSAARRFRDSPFNGTNSEDAGGNMELTINSSSMRHGHFLGPAEPSSFADDKTFTSKVQDDINCQQLRDHIRQCLELLKNLSDASAHDAPLTRENCLDNTLSANTFGILDKVDLLAEGDAGHHNSKANVTPACASSFLDSQTAVGVHPCVESLETTTESARSQRERSNPFVTAKSEIKEIVQGVTECTLQEGATKVSDLRLPPFQVQASGGSILAEMFEDQDLAVVEGQKTIESAQTGSIDRCNGIERNICLIETNHTLSSSTESIEHLSGGDMSEPDRGSSENKSNQSAFKRQVDISRVISRVSDDNIASREGHAGTGHAIGADSGSAGPDSFLSCFVEASRRQALERVASPSSMESDAVVVSSQVESNIEGGDDKIQPPSRASLRLESFERKRDDTGVVGAIERVSDAGETALVDRQAPSVAVIIDLDSNFGIASEQVQALVRKHSKEKTRRELDGSSQTLDADLYDTDFGVSTEQIELLSRPASASTLDLMGASTGTDSGLCQLRGSRTNRCSEVHGKLAESTSPNVTHGQRRFGLVLEAPVALGGHASSSRGQSLPGQVGFGDDDRDSCEHSVKLRSAVDLRSNGGERDCGSNKAAQPITTMRAAEDPYSAGTSPDRKLGSKQTLVDAFGLANFKAQLNSPRPACEGQSSSSTNIGRSYLVQNWPLGSQSIVETPAGDVKDKSMSEVPMLVTPSSKAVKFDLDACDQSFGVTTEAVMPQRKLADSFDLDLSDRAFGIKTEAISGFSRASRVGKDFAEIEVGEPGINGLYDVDSDLGPATQATGFNDDDSNLLRPTCTEGGSLGSDARMQDSVKSRPEGPASIACSDASTCQVQLPRTEALMTMMEEL